MNVGERFAGAAVCVCVCTCCVLTVTSNTLLLFSFLFGSRQCAFPAPVFFIWFALIPFSSSNPPCSPSSSQTSSALCFPPALPFPPPPPLRSALARLLHCAEELRLFRSSDSFGNLSTQTRCGAQTPGSPVRGNRSVDDASWRGWGPPPWHRQTLWDQMVQRSRPLLIKCARSPSLAVAPSTASQWKQRKLAPNYRLVSVKDGSGAAGVSVCEGWVAESLRDRGLPCA